MSKTLGFLTGVCLSLAAFVFLQDHWPIIQGKPLTELSQVNHSQAAAINLATDKVMSVPVSTTPAEINQLNQKIEPESQSLHIIESDSEDTKTIVKTQREMNVDEKAEMSQKSKKENKETRIEIKKIDSTNSSPQKTIPEATPETNQQIQSSELEFTQQLIEHSKKVATTQSILSTPIPELSRQKATFLSEPLFEPTPIPQAMAEDPAPPKSLVQPHVLSQTEALSQTDAHTINQNAKTDTHVTNQRHLFWSPFRSEWAAKGFARRLSNATQIPIKVIRENASRHRVFFHYNNEEQRLQYIERIEFITGLQLK